MLLNLFICLLLFFAITIGLAWPLAARLNLEPAEKLVASAVLSWLGIYLFAFATYVLGLPLAVFWLLPLLAAVGLFAGRKPLAEAMRDVDVRTMCVGQLLVTGWCVGGLALITSYSGGGWTGDWFEHWERTRFFLERWPQETKFLGAYPLSARPPLANLLVGAMLGTTGLTFAGFQLVTTCLNTLAFLPAALLARRFAAGPGPGATSGRGAIAVLTVLVMVNPSFVENATFAWTKLITAFFVLAGLYFFLRARGPTAARAALPLCAASLAGGMLAHYSGGPYAVLLALAWVGVNRGRLREPAFWRETALAGLVGGLMLATWFGWSIAVYGAHATFFSNSSVSVPDAQSGNQLLKIALNLRDTIVPHFLRPLDRALIAQPDSWGYLRDWFFQSYQVNFFLVFGSVGWLVLARELWRGWAKAAQRWFWMFFAAGAVVLGVGVHGARDTWGLAHICLQALVALGLACLAARWTQLERGWRIALVAGAAIDLLCGIVLQLAIEHQVPMRGDVLRYNTAALMNWAGKLQHALGFFQESLAVPPVVIGILLTGGLVLAVARVRTAAQRGRDLSP